MASLRTLMTDSEKFRCYKKSFESAEVDEERASSAKNLAATHHRLASVGSTVDEKLEHYSTCVLYRGEAHRYGKVSKSAEWNSSNLGSLENCLTDAMDALKGTDTGACLDWVCHMKYSVPDDVGILPRFLCLMGAVGILCTLANEAFTIPNYSQCLRFIHEFRSQAQEVKEAALKLDKMPQSEVEIISCNAGSSSSESEEGIFKILQNLEDLICTMQNCCESVQEQEKADAMFESIAGRAGNAEDEFWLIIDVYKRAATLARNGNAPVQESLVFSRLGRVYNNMRNYQKTEDYYRRALTVAQDYSLPFDKPWLKEASEALERSSSRLDGVDERRAKAVEELEDDLKELERAFRGGALSLLDHVYTTHPPKNPNHVPPPNDPERLKRSLLVAVSHYHPDKNSGDGYEYNWTILCEEVTKCLNMKYSAFSLT